MAYDWKKVFNLKNVGFGVALALVSMVVTWIIGLIKLNTIEIGLNAMFTVPVDKASALSAATGNLLTRYFNGFLPVDFGGIITVFVGFIAIVIIGAAIFELLGQAAVIKQNEPRALWQRMVLVIVYGLAGAGIILGAMVGGWLGILALLLAMLIYAIFLIAGILLALRIPFGVGKLIEQTLPEV